MKTEVNNSAIFAQAVAHHKKVLNVCNKEIEYLTHPEVYGCCLCKCNSIVINKERMMTVTTDEKHMTTYEFSPLYPTYFSPEAAKRIVKDDVYTDCKGNRIQMEIVGQLEYYKLLKAQAESFISVFESIEA